MCIGVNRVMVEERMERVHITLLFWLPREMQIMNAAMLFWFSESSLMQLLSDGVD